MRYIFLKESLEVNRCNLFLQFTKCDVFVECVLITCIAIQTVGLPLVVGLKSLVLLKSLHTIQTTSPLIKINFTFFLSHQ